MKFDLSRFKRITITNKLAVFGYIHKVQALFPSDDPYYNIHDLIKQICTLFYAPIAEWDLEFIGPYVKYIEQTNSIQQTKQEMCSSSFLKGNFNSGIHHWRYDRFDWNMED